MFTGLLIFNNIHVQLDVCFTFPVLHVFVGNILVENFENLPRLGCETVFHAVRKHACYSKHP